jgi:CubicO group peptidase (beta-lactamase class C family)
MLMRKTITLLLALLVVVSMSWCGPSEKETAEKAAAAALQERIERIENGLLPAATAKGKPIKGATIAERMEHYKVPGVSVAVINDGKIEWAKGYGVLEAGGDKAVDAETLFQAASISKPVAATVALRLVEEGKLALDEDVNLKLQSWKTPENEFTATKKVTLRNLLSHTGGVTVHGFPGYAASEPLPTLVQVLDGAKPANTDPIRVDVEPGTIWRYSGGGFTIAQQLMIDVSGKPFPELMKEKVLGPFGMTRSTYEQPLPEGLEVNAARAHGGDGKMIEGRWHTYPEMAAAGLWTTASDLAHFAIGIQKSYSGESNEAISMKTTAEMLTPVLDEYGLGLSVGGKDEWISFGHGGANAGFQCDLHAYTKQGMGAAIMTNSDNGSALAEEILRSLAKEYGWPDFELKEIEVADVDPAVMGLYTGRYQLLRPEYAFEVVVEAGTLFVISPEGLKIESLPETGIKYVLIDNGWSIEFKVDEAGTVTGATVLAWGREFEAKKVE